MEAKESLWKRCLENIKGQIPPEDYFVWFAPTYPKKLDGSLMTLAVPNQFFRKCLIENYRDLIETTLKSLTQKSILVNFYIESENPTDLDQINDNQEPLAIEPTKSVLSSVTSNLNPKYGFSSFVVGANNQFAHAAAWAVATNLASEYNPLFIYGSAGLGKTHLLHAIGNHLCKNNPNLHVKYLAAETFTIDLIDSIKRGQMPFFRKRYRHLDVLLIDDIQFLAGKERTQEEFFYTFNALYESHKQLVVTCDKYPKDLLNIDQRLKSRFESGLAVDIKAPDLETKIAIVHKKADFYQKPVPEEVANHIASNAKSNIRELEGLLLRVIAFSSFTDRKIDLKLTQEVLKDFVQDRSDLFTIPKIIESVASHYNIKASDIKSKNRTRNISTARQIAMFLCRQHTKYSLPEIGRQFGGKDHTTVIFSHKKISRLIKEDKQINTTIHKIIDLIEKG